MLNKIRENLSGYLRCCYCLILLTGLFLPLRHIGAYSADIEEHLTHEFEEADDEDFHEDKSQHRTRRVVGGLPDNGWLPSVVKYQVKVGNTTSSCTATVIGSEWVLTAQHCLKTGDDSIHLLNVRSILKRKRIQVAQVYPAKDGADFALLRLHSSQRSKIRIIQPPQLSFVPLSRDDYGKKVLVIGFAAGNRAYWRLVSVKGMDKRYIYSGHTDSVTADDPEYVVRSGDSGGPLLYNGKVVGTLRGHAFGENHRGANSHVPVAPQKTFVLTTMGLQWFHRPEGHLHLNPDLFSIDGRILCRVHQKGNIYFGTISSDSPYTLPQLWSSQGQNSCKYSRQGSTDDFEVAYAPYLSQDSSQWHPPDFRWSSFEGSDPSRNVIPVAWDDQGNPLFLCYSGQVDSKYPGTYSSADSFCRSFDKEYPDTSYKWVMAYSPQSADTDNWRLVRNGRPSTSTSSGHHIPCRRAKGQHLQTGSVVEIADGRRVCHIDGNNYRTYELPEPRLTEYRTWQSSREAFYKHTLGALSAGEDYYVNSGRQKTFCRINDNQVGAVDLEADTPICRTDNGESSLEFELFSRVLPLPDHVMQQTAPSWQMVITAEDKRGRKKHYCNGVKISDWLVVTSSECIQDRTLEHYSYQMTGVTGADKGETWSVSKILSTSCRKKQWDSDCRNLSLLISRNPISGRDDAPLAVGFYKKRPMVKFDGSGMSALDRATFYLTHSTDLISTLKFVPEDLHERDSLYFSLKQPLTQNIKLISHPDYTNYYRISAYDGGVPESRCPLSKQNSAPGSLLSSKFPDTAFITTAAPWVVTFGNQIQLLGFGGSEDCNNIVPAERIRNFIQLHTITDVKLASAKPGIEPGESEPCWLKPHNYNQPDGIYNNGSCLLNDNTRISSFYRLETSPDHEYQWANTGNAQQKPNNASTFGYSPEGHSMVLVKNDYSSELKSEDQLQIGDNVLTPIKSSIIDDFNSPYDRQEWYHCPNNQWPCHDSLSFKVKAGYEGWCRGRFNFKWITGRYRGSCEVSMPDNSVRTGDFYSQVMKKPRFYRRYDVEPVWSHKPDSALMSSLLRMESDNNSQKPAYLCRQGVGVAKHHSNKSLCKTILGDSFSGHHLVIERLLKHYPPDKAHYPEWKPVADDFNFLLPGALNGWWYDPGGGYLCLKVDVMENVLYLGYAFPADDRYCKLSRDEPTENYSRKRKRFSDYMVLKNKHYEWHSVLSEQIPEAAVIAQRHPQKGNASEFVCRSGQSYQPGKTSLDQKYCLIGLSEQKETNFDVLVLIPPTKPSTMSTAAIGGTTITKPTMSTENIGGTTNTKPTMSAETTATLEFTPYSVVTDSKIKNDEWSVSSKLLTALTCVIFVAIPIVAIKIVQEVKKHHLSKQPAAV